MRLTAARLLMGVAAAVLLAIASTADARDRGLGAQLGLPPAGLTARPYDRGLSPSDAARVAQQQNGGGRVLSVDPGDRGYRVKLLKDGNVRIVYVPRD